MSRLHRFALIALFVCLIFEGGVLSAPTVRAATVTHSRLTTLVPHTTNAKHVTILVLDMSGSMAGNDPNKIRCSAAYAYIDLSSIGDFIGVVDLDGGVPLALAQPAEMSTLAARNSLKNTIRTKTNDCAPDADTPTADALKAALQMLTSATTGGIDGSVILLTDGIPDPNSTDQENTINTSLIPQFRNHLWPVDTIALGQPDPSFHGFLEGIAKGTGGDFYDDNKGDVAGPSPLNIADFFLQIFTKRVGHTQGPGIGLTDIGGGTIARDFTLASNVDYFAVLIVKESADAKVTLYNPSNQAVTSGPGIFVSSDPQYVMYIINGPQGGNWTVQATGTGKFKAVSLFDSALKLQITAPDHQAKQGYPLGAPITITAMLTYKGAIVTGNYTVTAILTFSGDSGSNLPYEVTEQLSDPNGSGTYTGTVTVPIDQKPGSYSLIVGASQTSSPFLTSDALTLSLALFPSAVLFTHGAIVGDPVTAQAVAFDRGLQKIYGGTFPTIQWLSHGPLDNHPAIPQVAVHGRVELNGQPYCNAEVRGTAQLITSTSSVPITVQNGQCGAFEIFFPADVSGTYEVDLASSGSYDLSLGRFGAPTKHQAIVVISPATTLQETRAWLWTLLLYPLELFILISIIRSRFMPDPAKAVYRIEGTNTKVPVHLKHSNWFWRLMQRNIVPSERVFSRQGGMALSVDRAGVIKVRRARWPFHRHQWYAGRGQRLPARFTSVNEVFADSPTTPHYVFGGRGSGMTTAGRGSANVPRKLARATNKTPVKRSGGPSAKGSATRRGRS